MNPRARNTDTDGCARVGASSDTALASESYDQVIPAEETPFHLLVVIVSIRAIRSSGASAAPEVKMIVLSISTGTPNPPAVVVPSEAARLDSRSSNSWKSDMAWASSEVRKLRVPNMTDFWNARRYAGDSVSNR